MFDAKKPAPPVTIYIIHCPNVEGVVCWVFAWDQLTKSKKIRKIIVRFAHAITSVRPRKIDSCWLPGSGKVFGIFVLHEILIPSRHFLKNSVVEQKWRASSNGLFFLSFANGYENRFIALRYSVIAKPAFFINGLKFYCHHLVIKAPFLRVRACGGLP